MSARCIVCGDGHRMWLSSADRYVPCTSCPVPCRECAGDEGRAAYCAIADCHCSCHHWLGANERSVPPPELPTRDDLIALLRRWRDLDAETPEGDHERTESATWREAREALADATDRAIAAELRRTEREVQL